MARLNENTAAWLQTRVLKAVCERLVLCGDGGSPQVSSIWQAADQVIELMKIDFSQEAADAITRQMRDEDLERELNKLHEGRA